MPEPDYVWLPREDILQFEEIETLVDIFTSLGVDKVRLTGGEPLLRRDLPDLIQKLAARPAIRDLAMACGRRSDRDALRHSPARPPSEMSASNAAGNVGAREADNSPA